MIGCIKPPHLCSHSTQFFCTINLLPTANKKNIFLTILNMHPGTGMHLMMEKLRFCHLPLSTYF